MTQPIPFSFQSHQLRIVERNGEPWFIAKDVAEILEYSHTPHMLRILDEDEKGVHIVDRTSSGGNPEMAIISESGLYHAIFLSRKPQAKAFRRWVTEEVLPQIRKTGGYRQDDTAKHDVLIQRVELLEEMLDLYRFKAQVLTERTRPKPKRRPSEPVTDEEVAQIRQMAAEGLGVCEIARQIGRSSATVSFILRGAKGGAS